MDVIDEQQAPPQSGLDLDRFRLRTFIEGLMGTDELQVRDERIDLADVAEVLEGNPRAVLLRQVLCQRTTPRSPAPMAERVERAGTLVRARATKLSEREQQVVARIACGITNDGIANDLGISPATVLTLRRRAYAKLGVRSCVELSWLVG